MTYSDCRLPIGDPSIDEWAKTLPDNEREDMWETMDESGHNRPKFIKSYVEWMHKRYLNGLESEDKSFQILRGPDLKKYLMPPLDPDWFNKAMNAPRV